jgi:hypothetical protein
MPAGRRGVESGVFWLGDRAATSAITAVAHPTGEGVEETPFSWRVSPEVYAAIARWARPRGLTLLAVAHVHLSEARPRLSPTDRSQGLKVQHALSVILPRGGREPNPKAWGWFVYEGAEYRELPPAEAAVRIARTGDDVEFVVIGARGTEAT